MNPGEVEADFIASLRDAMNWSSRRLSGTTDYSRLRSAELAACHAGVTDPYGQSMTAVNALVDTRSSLIGNTDLNDVSKERLLCCDLAASEASGASQLASAGYFNEFDLAPWDTWVAWLTDYKPTHEHNGYILAFVPPSCIHVVQLGIDANPVECVFWLGSADVFAAKRLRHVMPTWLAEYACGNAP